jgi:hypothetical protein
VAIRASANGVNAQGTLISNNITNNGNGGVGFPGGGIVLLQVAGVTGTPVATAHFNRIVGNSVGLDNSRVPTAATVDATNNFWGSNAGPGGPGSDTVSGPVTFNPWLVLQVTATPGSVPPGGVATVVADLTGNNAGMNTSALGHLPDGIPVAFATTAGTVTPPTGTTLSGKATATLTAGNAPGTVTVSATVDNQTSTAMVTVVSAPPNCTIPPFATTPNQKFVAQVFCDLLDRTVDPGGLIYWTGFLAQGTTPSQVVLGIEFALPNEYQTIQVESIYQQFLHHAADPVGLQAGVAFLNGGGTLEQLAAMVAGSPEFFALAGGTNAGFLSALYQDALGRAVDPSGAAGWGSLLAQGVPRSTVALGVLSSLEYQADLVRGYYEMFLRRAADPVGLAFFTGLLHQGSTDQQVIALIVGSPEYYAGAQTGQFQAMGS